ncbi:MAG: AAA family ATPase [Pirellulales bacterium]|nr:AAA family ATPase [Pirellulales bacterium]
MSELRIDFDRPTARRGSVIALTARYGDQQLNDRFDIARADLREHFVERICKRWKPLRAQRAAIVEQLEALAARTIGDLAGVQQGVPAAPLLVPMHTVEPRPVDWLWPGRLALGKLALLVGDPGLGKSFVTCDLAARVSAGKPWPDIPWDTNAAGGVVIANAEDDLADTVRPRLDAAGADVSRIVALRGVQTTDDEGRHDERPLTLHDRTCIEAAIVSVASCKLVIIDPLGAFCGATDSHKNADVRAMLAPLAELAARHNVAVLAVGHLNKGSGQAVYRTSGSLAFVAAVRTAWAVTRDREDPTGPRRLLLAVKSNLSVDQGGLAFSVGPYGAHDEPAVAWEADPVRVSADEALAAEASGAEDRSEREEALEFLRDRLADGPVAVVDVNREARSQGIADRTLRRARRALGVLKTKDGLRGGWSLSLPPDDAGLVWPEAGQDWPEGGHEYPKVASP